MWQEVTLCVREMTQQGCQRKKNLADGRLDEETIRKPFQLQRCAGSRTFFLTCREREVASSVSNVCKAPLSTAFTWTTGLLQEKDTAVKEFGWATQLDRYELHRLSMFYLAKADPKTDAELSCSWTSELFRTCKINWKPPMEHRVWPLST